MSCTIIHSVKSLGLCSLFCAISAAAFSQEPPVIPVGLDAYRMWDRWPYQRIGARAYMRSTYDRRGGNEGADASHFLYQLRDDFNVTLDVEGPGVLYFARYNHWHGSPWHYEVDGVDHVVQESSTADPNHPVPNSVFIPERLFPNPLTWTWALTKGADLIWVPIPFERRFRMAYSRTRYGTGYYIYHQYARGANLSRPIRSWDGRTPPDADVLELLARAGTDIAPRPATPEGDRLGVREEHGRLNLPAKQALTLARIGNAPSMLRALELSVPRPHAVAFGRARIQVFWDDRPRPSIDAPVALFYGAGTLYNREGREYLVKGFPIHVRFDNERVYLACYYPMPFFRSAIIQLIGANEAAIPDVQWSVRYVPYQDPISHVAYFHATYRDHASPVAGQDLVALDTRRIEGGGDWSGHFVGMSWIFSHRAVLNTLEGDPRFFFDDSLTPQCYGTGTEEWGGGGDYWGGRNMTLPFAGHPVGARNAQEAKCEEDLIQSAYRFLLADLMPFGRNAVIRLEHGGTNQSTEHYETVTYWYGAPSPTLIQTDALDVGDPESEKAHDYVSRPVSPVVEVTSRYEWGIDTLPGGEAAPEANPLDYAEIAFDAEADNLYYIWVRGKNVDGNNLSDAFWLQFDEAIGTTKLGETYNHPKGFGNWLDRFPAGQYAWSSALPQDPPQTITFSKPGRHRLRIQPRHGKHYLDQIWLSAAQKTLPESRGRVRNPKADDAGNSSRTEIILDAADLITVAGAIRVVNDPDTSIGKALEIDRSAREVYPAHTETGRFTLGTSEFSVKLVPDNHGVLLRRTLDYSLPNQRAEVYIADAGKGRKSDDLQWALAGVWYLAGSNTCVYSNPREELGATQHIVQTSNRRFRDDEFLVPRGLTKGRSAIRVRVKFTPVEVPLFPGHPLPDLAWSELRYAVYCLVMAAPELSR